MRRRMTAHRLLVISRRFRGPPTSGNGGYTCGMLAAADESVDARVFSANEIPWDELAFDSTRDALRDYVRLYCGS